MSALLTTYLRPYRGTVAWLALCLFIGTGFQLAAPQLLSYFLDLNPQGDYISCFP